MIPRAVLELKPGENRATVRYISIGSTTPKPSETDPAAGHTADRYRYSSPSHDYKGNSIPSGMRYSSSGY